MQCYNLIFAVFILRILRLSMIIETPKNEDSTMIDTEKLIADYATGVINETAFVNQVALIAHREINIENYAWLAYKDALDTSAARQGIPSGEMAKKWLKALKENRLHATLGHGDILLISER